MCAPSHKTRCGSTLLICRTCQEALAGAHRCRYFWPAGSLCRAGKMCRLEALCRAFVQSLMQALSKTVQGFTLRPQSACLKVRDA